MSCDRLRCWVAVIVYLLSFGFRSLSSFRFGSLLRMMCGVLDIVFVRFVSVHSSPFTLLTLFPCIGIRFPLSLFLLLLFLLLAYFTLAFRAHFV